MDYMGFTQYLPLYDIIYIYINSRSSGFLSGICRFTRGGQIRLYIIPSSPKNINIRSHASRVW